MKMYIFRKENDRDFERIEIEIMRPRDKSIIIRHKGQVMTLEWDSEYTFQQLRADDILNIYIVGEDYSRGYMMPILRDLSIKDLDISVMIRSMLDKIRQKSEEEIQSALGLLKEVVRFYTGKSVEDLHFLQDIIKISDQGESHFQSVKELLNKRKMEKEGNHR